MTKHSFVSLLLFLIFRSTAFSAPQQFVVIGDSGKNNGGQKQSADAVTRHCEKEKCDFGILAGDNIYEVGMRTPDDPVIEEAFTNHYSHLGFTFYVTLGNHDYGDLAMDWKRGTYQVNWAKKNPQYYLPNFYYTSEFDHMILAVIDTSRLMWRKDYAEQERMVISAYQRAQTLGKWFVVLGHHPYLSNGKHGNAGRYQSFPFPSFISGKPVKEFLDKNVCGKAQLYIAGHDHSLQYLDGRQSNCSTMLLISGAAASPDVVGTRNQMEFGASTLGFATMIVDATTIDIRFMDSKNTVLYQDKLNLSFESN